MVRPNNTTGNLRMAGMCELPVVQPVRMAVCPGANGKLVVPNPKFALLRSTLGANFGFDKDASKLMVLVSFMIQKFAQRTRGNDGANF
jgi:hypothetical protein